jgi:hypothetical protein
VARSVASDKSPDKPLPQKSESLMMLQPPRLNVAATYFRTVQRMGPRHLGFVETASKGNIDLLLHGDSITDWWVQGDANKAMFAKAVMLMIGTHNAGTSSGPEIAEGVGAVVLEMRKDFPDAKILQLAVFPRGMPDDPIRAKLGEANKIISRLDDRRHVFYLDIGPKFLDEKGYFLPDTFRDTGRTFTRKSLAQFHGPAGRETISYGPSFAPGSVPWEYLQQQE